MEEQATKPRTKGDAWRMLAAELRASPDKRLAWGGTRVVRGIDATGEVTGTPECVCCALGMLATTPEQRASYLAALPEYTRAQCELVNAITDEEYAQRVNAMRAKFHGVYRDAIGFVTTSAARYRVSERTGLDDEDTIRIYGANDANENESEEARYVRMCEWFDKQADLADAHDATARAESVTDAR